MKKSPEKLNRIIIPKKWDDKTRQDLINDLNSLSDDDIMRIAENIEKANKKQYETLQEIMKHYKVIWEIKEIWWKPAFCVHDLRENWWDSCVFRWKDQYCDWVDEIEELQEIWWRPAFRMKKDRVWYDVKW